MGAEARELDRRRPSAVESVARGALGMVKVAVIGTGYVGTVAAVSFAAVGHPVVGIENDEHKLSALRSGAVPFYEPGLADLLRDVATAGRLTFTSDLAGAVSSADVVFICVGTPPGPDGRPDLTALRLASRAVGEAASGRTVVITKSTVPIGWGAELAAILDDASEGGDADLAVVSNPEFLREGTAVGDFLYPDRVVLGGEDRDAVDLVAGLYRPILEQSFPQGNRLLRPALIRTDTATAETIKYAANGFLAMKITYINEISRICDTAGADVEMVAEAVGLDHRIERKYLGAGIGFGGSCFGKDLQALTTFGDDHRIPLPVLSAVNPSNQIQRHQVVDKLRSGLGSLRDRRIALLGLAYKPDTDDLRDAPSVTIAAALLGEGADVVAYDPVVKHVEELPQLLTEANAYEAVTGADAVVLTTEWKEFAALDFVAVASLMRGDLLVDGRNWLDPAAVAASGLRYDAMGRRAYQRGDGPAG